MTEEIQNKKKKIHFLSYLSKSIFENENEVKIFDQNS